MHGLMKITVATTICCLQATLAILDKLDIETDKPTEEEVAKKFGFEESYHNGRSLHCK